MTKNNLLIFENFDFKQDPKLILGNGILMMQKGLKIKGVYAIVCLNNKNVYIGSSQHVKRRITEHLYCLSKSNHHNQRLQNIYNKYGRHTLS